MKNRHIYWLGDPYTGNVYAVFRKTSNSGFSELTLNMCKEIFKEPESYGRINQITKGKITYDIPEIPNNYIRYLTKLKQTKNEIKIMLKLNQHDNIIQLYDSLIFNSEINIVFFLIMELGDGGTLVEL